MTEKLANTLPELTHGLHLTHTHSPETSPADKPMPDLGLVGVVPGTLPDP